MQIKYDIHDIGGEVVKDNETYLLKDNKTLKNLVLSSTRLYRGQATRGHSHEGQEEVYFFVQGTGRMIVGNEESESFAVSPGDVVLIPDGAFHRVINDGEMNLTFNCVFDGKRNH
jgi:oxalate decarboxylase/phosphoglucose isomerase-like protein (cupin superfamily)